jgi:ribonuclease E
VIDFIDMESMKNRRTVEATLRTALSLDKAHTEISGISKFGIVEMTRERMRTAYFESINRKCEICDGSGIIMTEEMVALTAFREIQTRAANGGVKVITCKLPVESMNYLVNMKRNELSIIEKEDKVLIRLAADTNLSPGQYTITVEKTEEEKAAFKEEKRAEHKPVHPPAHKTEHIAEHKPEPKAEHNTESGPEHKEHAPEQKGESDRPPKRRSRSRGRRRPKHGLKTGPAAETVGTSALEPTQAEAGDEESSSGPFPVQHKMPVDMIQEDKPEAVDEKRPGHEVEHDRDHQADHTSELRPEAGKHTKRSRSWGRRRPKSGPKPGPSSETAAIDVDDTPKTETGPWKEEPSAD